jgi:hypothetical protein
VRVGRVGGRVLEMRRVLLTVSMAISIAILVGVPLLLASACIAVAIAAVKRGNVLVAVLISTPVIPLIMLAWWVVAFGRS